MDAYDAQLRAGYVHAQRGDHEAAIACICEAVARAPERPAGHRALAEVLLAAGRPLEAASEARLAMRGDPEDPVCLEVLGSALLAAGRVRDAADAFEHGRFAHPQHLAFYLHASVARRALGDGARAVEHAEAAASLYPGAPLAALELGLAYVEAERWGDAEAALERAARLPDVAHDAEAARANLAFLRGDLDDAERRARAVITEDPGHEGARDALASARAARTPVVGGAWRRVVARGSYGAMGTQAAVVTCAALGAAAGGLLVPGALVGAAAISYAAGITYTRYRYDRLREAQPDGEEP